MTTTVLAYIPSPSQGVWYIGFVPIRAYALCIIAGIVAALIIGDRRWEARGGERGVIYDVALWAVPFGLIGGRMYHVMTDWQKYFGADGAGFFAALRIWDGGLGIWGAVALGGVGAWIACHRRGIPLPAFGDAIAPGIILAQAIGRLGNYFNQELYGRETDLPWGLTIYDRLDPSGVVSPHSLDGVSTGQVYAVVHPTFLYELIWNLLVFVVLIWADRRFKLGHGRLFALYVAGYCVGRFWVELMRSDTATLIAGIRVNTFTSTFVFIGAVIYIMAAPKGREEPSTLRGTDADRSLVDDLGEELVAVGATSGVVAAAKVAGDEDEAGSDFTGGADTESEAAAEAEDLTEQVETAASEDIAEAESFAEAGAEAAERRETGLGSVEGEEAIEAEVGAPEAHEAAVEGAAEAESLAEDVAVEPSSPDEAPPAETPAPPKESLGFIDGDEVEAAETDADDETPATAPEDGLGSVDGDEVGPADATAGEVHAAAVEGAQSAEATAEDIAAETAADPEDGLGSVDGDDVEPADATAGETAVETSADENTTAAETPATAPEDGLGSVDGDDVGPAETDTADTAAEDTAAETPATAPEDGLGSIDGDDVGPAETDTADTAAEDTAAETPATAPEDGLGSIDGDDVEAAKADAGKVHEAATEGTASAEAVAEKLDAATRELAEAPRRRWWRRS